MARQIKIGIEAEMLNRKNQIINELKTNVKINETERKFLRWKLKILNNAINEFQRGLYYKIP